MTTHIFLGPSLAMSAARSLLPAAIFHGPAALGDIHAVAEHAETTCVCLIDGQFLGTPAVWHKEVSYALSKGIRVVGAASMGALRAAEMHGLGMEGIGRIFELYRDGICHDDDEVAVLYAPQELEFACCSVAMISLRYGLALASEQGLLDEASAHEVAADIKRFHFSERTWEHVGRAVHRYADAATHLVDFLASPACDLKRLDALKAIQAVQTPAPRSAPKLFEPTVFWRQFLDEHTARQTQMDKGERQRLIDYWRLRDSESAPLQAAWLELVEERCAQAMSLRPAADEVHAELTAIRREHRLLSPSDVSAWAQSRDLSMGHLRNWALASARRKLLQRTLATRLPGTLLNVLRRRGSVEACLRDLAGAANTHPQPNVPETLSSNDLDALWLFCKERFGAFHGTPRDVALRKGFDNEHELLSALMHEQLLNDITLERETS